MMTAQTKPAKATIREKIVSVMIWIIGSLYFVVLIPFAILLMILFKPRTYDKAVKCVCRFFVRGLFIKVRPEGLENIDPSQTYIFMSNHVNIFDAFILNGDIPNFVRAVELNTHFNWPIYGTAIRRFGNIPISSKNPRQAFASLKKAEQALNQGSSILILPEGSRTLDGNLKPFKRGPFLLAKNVRFDVVPVVLKGSYHVKRKGDPLIRPGTITCRFGRVIPSAKIHQLKTDDLRQYVRDIMQKMMEP
jgi:1-acyl-sn-glycerol-3-phosphate acyltransferase